MNDRIQAITMLAKQLLRQKVTDLQMVAPPLPIDEYRVLMKELGLQAVILHDHYEVHWMYECQAGKMLIVLQSEPVGVMVFDHITIEQDQA